MDDQATESRTGALRSERTRAAPFACADIGPGAIAMTSATIVQRLTGRAAIAVVFWFVSETLGSGEGTPLSVDAAPGAPVRRGATIHQPLQKLSVPVSRVRRSPFWLSSLRFRE